MSSRAVVTSSTVSATLELSPSMMVFWPSGPTRIRPVPVETSSVR